MAQGPKAGKCLLARLQTLVLDAVAPQVHILEEACRGTLSGEAAAEAAKAALGNASANSSRETLEGYHEPHQEGIYILLQRKRRCASASGKSLRDEDEGPPRQPKVPGGHVCPPGEGGPEFSEEPIQPPASGKWQQQSQRRQDLLREWKPELTIPAVQWRQLGKRKIPEEKEQREQRDFALVLFLSRILYHVKFTKTSRFTRGNTLLSIVSCEPNETRGDRTHCYRVGKAIPATSRLLTVFHTQLRKNNTGTVGPRTQYGCTRYPSHNGHTTHVLHDPCTTTQRRIDCCRMRSQACSKNTIGKTTPRGQGFLSTLFLVPKDGGQRPVINLKSLNKFVHTEHFKMEAVSKAKCQLEPTQTIESLGFMVSQELSLPNGTIKKIRAETRVLLGNRQVSIRKLSQFLGKLQAATRAIPLVPPFFRKRVLKRGLASVVTTTPCS